MKRERKDSRGRRTEEKRRRSILAKRVESSRVKSRLKYDGNKWQRATVNDKWQRGSEKVEIARKEAGNGGRGENETEKWDGRK